MEFTKKILRYLSRFLSNSHEKGKAKNEFEIYSSKIKKIYIELPDFSFEHGNINKKSNKFIGRKRIKDRLREILVNNKTKSGAYLITGYRGIGKSSFVNAVINEIGGVEVSFKTFRYYLLYYLIFISEIFLLDFIIKKELFIINKYFFIISCFVYIIYYLLSSLIESLKNKVIHKKNEYRIIYYLRLISKKAYKVIIHPLILTFGEKQNNFHISFFQFIYFNSWFLIIIFLSKIELNYRYAYKFILFLVIIKIVIYTFRIMSFKIEKSHNPFKSIICNILNLVKDFINTIKNKYNYSRNIYIKINLGYDDLKVDDILRLITRNLKESYQSSYHKLYKTFGIKIFYKIFILFLIFSFLDQPNLKDIHSRFLYNTGICNELPFFYHSLYQNEYTYSHSGPNYKNKISIILKNSDSTTYFLNQNNIILTKEQSSYERLKNIFKNTCVLIDDFIQNLTNLVVSFINENIFFNKFNYIIIKYHFNCFNYFILLYYFIIYYIGLLIFRLPFLNTNYSVLKKLNILNKRIYAKYSNENNKGISNTRFPLIYNILHIERYSYPIPDIREIENNLIEILNDIQNIYGIFKPQLFFIFDELDKIEPVSKIITGEKESELKEVFSRHSPSFSPESTRERQRSIYKLLSNLKYFITTAKAKFIFIAGREMYDASLADVSDRNFFIGSIFHDVIYVDSFLTDPTDDLRSNDVTSMVENYVCNIILPEDYKKYLNKTYLTLSDYNTYLFDCFQSKRTELTDRNIIKKILKTETYYKPNSKQLPKFNDNNQQIDSLERIKYEKVITLLYQFIIYLTHSSNGAPKKVVSFFEKHVEFVDNYEETTNAFFVLKDKNSKFFLSFDNEDQLKVGLIHYLSSPIIFSILDRIKSHDDKLLVSSSFLVDQLFKFSRYGFSWRNLESTYELLDVNKTPELRGFITNIIHYLSRIHIQELNSGLFNFSFSKKITKEISYLSKISEEASATFNFTLDESQSIKQFYHNNLRDFQKRYENRIYNDLTKTDFIHSIVSMHMLIGDLFYYDEEYNDAIVEYMDAVELMRKVNPKDLNPTTIVLFTRNMLKLGLTFEKRKSFDSAYLTFSEITEFLIRYRDIDLKKLGLTVVNIKDNINNKNFKAIINSDYKYDGINIVLQETIYNEEINPIIIEQNNENDFKFLIEDDHEFSDKIIVNGITPQIEKIINKIATFEGIRLIYQPLLAKLQIIEKSHLGGIQEVDIKRIIKEFDFLQKLLYKKDKFLIECDFYNKMGNILYYKNGFIRRHNVNSIFQEYCLYKNHCNVDNYISFSCQACYCYSKSISTFIEFEYGDKIKQTNNNFYQLLKILINDFVPPKNFNSTNFSMIAGILSDIGDNFLSCLINKREKQENEINIIKFVKLALSYLWSDENIDFESSKKYKRNSLKKLIKYHHYWENNHFINIFLCYYLSAQFYKNADNHKLYSLQYTKLLYLIKEIFILEKDKNSLSYERKNIDIIIKNLSQKVLKNIIIGYYNTYHEIHVSEIYKIMDFQNFDRISDDIFLKRLTINTDLLEADLLFAEIKIRFSSDNKNKRELIEWYFKNSSFSQYAINDTTFNRILRLKFKAFLNYNILKELGYQDFTKINDPKDIYTINKSTLLNHLIELINYQNNNKNECNILDWLKVFNIENKDNIVIQYLDFLWHLISDSIFCNNEIIKTAHTYGINYLLNHSYIAYHHKCMADWCILYESSLKILKDTSNYYNRIDKNSNKHELISKLKNKIKNNSESNNQTSSAIKLQIFDFFYTKYKKNIYFNKIDEYKNKISELIGSDNMKFISAHYHIEMAIEHYHAARQTHSEGAAYKNFIEDMSYLNDDFCDKQNSLSISLERYCIRNKTNNAFLQKLIHLGEISNQFKTAYYTIDPLNYNIKSR